MPESNEARVSKLQLTMFERVMITVAGAALVWVGVTVTKNAVAIARLETHSQLVSAEMAIIKRKIDSNILPIAKLRLDSLEERVGTLEHIFEKELRDHKH